MRPIVLMIFLLLLVASEKKMKPRPQTIRVNPYDVVSPTKLSNFSHISPFASKAKPILHIIRRGHRKHPKIAMANSTVFMVAIKRRFKISLPTLSFG